MQDWKRIFSESISSVRGLRQLSRSDIHDIERVIRKYPMRVNPYYFSLIKKKGDPVWKQCIPDLRELRDGKGVGDPLLEEKFSPFFGLVHRYPDRALLLVSNVCSTYCRFCTRKRKVGKRYTTLKDRDFKRAVRYIESHKGIRDVIISGGDPLLLDDRKLESYIRKIRSIRHVDIIRIDSRTPCTLPQRITPALCGMLKKYGPIYFLAHFNHPDEITPEAAKACGMLADSGIVLGNQSVLLKGVNDDPETLKKLGQELLKIRVRPYYIYIPDAVRGTYHFRVSIKRARRIMRKLIGFTSGLAVPHLIIDLEGGGGKLRLLPDYVVSKKGKTYRFKNFEGRLFTYHDV